MTAYILAIAKKMVILEISEPHSVLVCVEARSSFLDREDSCTPVIVSTIK